MSAAGLLGPNLVAYYWALCFTNRRRKEKKCYWWRRSLTCSAHTGVANKLHCLAVGRRRHPSLQDHEDAEGSEAPQSHVPHAGDEGEHGAWNE